MASICQVCLLRLEIETKITEIMVPALHAGRWKSPTLISRTESHGTVNSPHYYIDIMVGGGARKDTWKCLTL